MNKLGVTIIAIGLIMEFLVLMIELSSNFSRKNFKLFVVIMIFCGLVSLIGIIICLINIQE